MKEQERNEIRGRTPLVDLCTFVYAVTVAELNEFVNSFSPWYIGFSSGGIPNKTRWIFSRIEQSS